MIAYRKTAGRAHDLRCVADDHVAAPGEFTLPGWDLPDIATLHDSIPVDVAERARIDGKIADIEKANPFTHRALREGIYAQALAAAVFNQMVGAVEAEIRTIPGHEGFTLPRMPNIAGNYGMVKIKAADDAIKAWRAQRP